MSDVKLKYLSPADSTGTHSLYTTYQGYEVMFHVSTMLPYMPNNPQQVRAYEHRPCCLVCMVCTAEKYIYDFPSVSPEVCLVVS